MYLNYIVYNKYYIKGEGKNGNKLGLVSSLIS